MTFDIDANGILSATAVENASGKRNQITINNDKGRLTKEQIDRMIEDAEKYKEQDEQIKAAIAAKNDLEMYVYQVKSMVSGKPWEIGVVFRLVLECRDGGSMTCNSWNSEPFPVLCLRSICNEGQTLCLC